MDIFCVFYKSPRSQQEVLQGKFDLADTDSCEYTHEKDVSLSTGWLAFISIQSALTKGGGLLDGTMVKNLSARAGNVGLILESGRSSGIGTSKLLQCSCLGSAMDRGAWWATVHGVTESQTRLSTQAFYQAFCQNFFAELDCSLGLFLLLLLLLKQAR